jgi:hypothetical protein
MRLNFSILFVLLMVGLSSGQDRKFQLGVMGSSQISFINTNHLDADVSSALTFGFGGLMEYSFTERYALSSGFEFVRRGGSLNINDTTGKYRANFIQIPIQIKMRTRQFGYHTYFAEMGFALGFETGEEVNWEPSRELDNSSFISLFDATFRIGLGWEYDLGAGTKALARLQYHRALTNNLLADEDPRLDEQFLYRFDYVSVTVGILF